MSTKTGQKSSLCKLFYTILLGAVAKVDESSTRATALFYIQKQKTDSEESAVRGIVRYAH